MTATDTYPRTITINHIMVALQVIVMLGKVVVCLGGFEEAIMSHGIAEIEDFRYKVWCCSCSVDKAPLID